MALQRGQIEILNKEVEDWKAKYDQMKEKLLEGR
jgi:hypothetical protein